MRVLFFLPAAVILILVMPTNIEARFIKILVKLGYKAIKRAIEDANKEGKPSSDLTYKIEGIDVHSKIGGVSKGWVITCS